MRFRSLSLILTDDCNFACSYCYKAKGQSTMAWETAERALSFFLPHLIDNAYVIFYGGEPLLAFDLIREAVRFIEDRSRMWDKPIRFSITTNGSLITPEVADFFASHRFYVVLSFDGLAQEIHRHGSSLKEIDKALDLLKDHPGIDLDVNSVFTPESVYLLSDSLQYIWQKGVPNVAFSLSSKEIWGPGSQAILKAELKQVETALAALYERAGTIPVESYAKPQQNRIFRCTGGQDRMAVTPEGQVWGCDLFASHFSHDKNHLDANPFYFGRINDFITSHPTTCPKISQNYARLSTDNFASPTQPCFLCDYLPECGICPIDAAFSGHPLGQVPAHLCEIKRILIDSKRRFRERINPSRKENNYRIRQVEENPS